MSEKDEFEKRSLFRQLSQTQALMVGFASLMGHSGKPLNGTEKRKYYRQVGKQQKLVIDLKKRGWYDEFVQIGIG